MSSKIPDRYIKFPEGPRFIRDINDGEEAFISVAAICVDENKEAWLDLASPMFEPTTTRPPIGLMVSRQDDQWTLKILAGFKGKWSRTIPKDGMVKITSVIPSA